MVLVGTQTEIRQESEDGSGKQIRREHLPGPPAVNLKLQIHVFLRNYSNYLLIKSDGDWMSSGRWRVGVYLKSSASILTCYHNVCRMLGFIDQSDSWSDQSESKHQDERTNSSSLGNINC